MLTRESVGRNLLFHNTMMRQNYSIRRCWTCIQSRPFSVKELSWCNPSGSPNRTAPVKNADDRGDHDNQEPIEPMEPINRFGIVSAMSKNRIIGVHGKLPWDLPNDRQHFKSLTRDKIIILGRKTYHDTPRELNIRHARSCIVVSRTAPEDMGSDKVQVARSLPEALHLAKQLEEKTDGDSLDCWVCGGERLYTEALQHKSAYELHLTMVDTMVDVVPLENGQSPEMALFPAKYRWDRHFDEVSRRLEADNGADAPDCSYVVYRRKKR